MKKVLIFCLILLCTLSVFAADVSAKAKVYLSYGDGGFSSANYKSTWEPVIALSTSADKAGCSIKWRPVSFNSSDFDITVWVKPFYESTNENLKKYENTKIDVGTYWRADSNYMAYGAVYFETKDFSYKESSVSKDNSIYAALGFGYKPNSINDFTNADLFVAGYFNNVNKNFGTIHFDGVLKLNIEDNKPSLNYSLSELTFNRFKFENPETTDIYYFGLNDSTDKIVAISNLFDFDEPYYFDHESRYAEQDTSGIFNTGFVAGLRYKYFTDADKSVYNGLYGYGLGSYALTEGEGEEKHSTYSFEAEAEIGLKNAELEIESRGSRNGFSEKVYSLYEFDWANGKVEAGLTDFYAKFIPASFAQTYIKIDYENLKTNSAKDNGFFINPGFATSFGACGLEVNATVGIDSLKNFRWNVEPAFTVNF